MRIVLSTILIGILLVALPHSQSTTDSRPSGSLDRAFASSGRVSMDLSAGEYRISGSSENRIHMSWTVRDQDALADVRTAADVRGQEATLRTDGPDGRNNGHFKVDITVPTNSDLHVRLTAGELTIEGIEGNKDVALHAGEVRIDVGRPEDYRFVDASLWAGDIDARAFGVNKGGLFRSFDRGGNGRYRLKVHLKAGEIRLYSLTKP